MNERNFDKRVSLIIFDALTTLPVLSTDTHYTRSYLSIREGVFIRGILDTYLDIQILRGYFSKTTN